MIFRVFILIFCLELTVREQLDQNDFRHYYGNFPESTILKLPDYIYVENSFATITSPLTTAFERHLAVQIFTDIDHHRCQFFFD